MPLWGNVDNANNQPKYVYALTRSGPQGSGNANEAANTQSLYKNTTPGAFGSNSAVGSFPVTLQEFANTSAVERTGPAHVGWQIRIAGEGGLNGLTISAGGTGYSNTDTIAVSNGSINATATLVTNSTGGIISSAITAPGMFTNVGSTAVAVKAANGSASAGSGATIAPVLGGRAGRFFYETIVAMGSITGTGNTIPS